MVRIPTQRRPEPDIYLTWAQAGLGPDTEVDLGDGTSMPLRELLGESDDDSGDGEDDDDHDW